MNTFGEKFAFTSFGESHGRAIGGVLDGVPAGLHIDLEMIKQELDRRAGRAARCLEAKGDEAKGDEAIGYWLWAIGYKAMRRKAMRR